MLFLQIKAAGWWGYFDECPPRLRDVTIHRELRKRTSREQQWAVVGVVLQVSCVDHFSGEAPIGLVSENAGNALVWVAHGRQIAQFVEDGVEDGAQWLCHSGRGEVGREGREEEER